MQKYNFYELDGFQLIEQSLKNGNAAIDLSTRTKYKISEVIKTVDAHNDNALFYQVKKCIEELSKSEYPEFLELTKNWDENTLKNMLVYIDFSEVFPIEKYAARKFHKKLNNLSKNDKMLGEEDIKTFFANGFSIRHLNETEEIHYVPFEKSASMARESSMIFIDERLYDYMEERLRLGLNFYDVKIYPSKLYAYTGLYLTDAKRIDEIDDLVFNEETVVVLDDKTTSISVENTNDENKEFFNYLQKLKIITANVDGAEPHDVKIEQKLLSIIEPKLNHFDGEGLISPEYCKIVNRILKSKYNMKGNAASMQIRMPFTKGMLHNVDFHGFICEKLGVASCDLLEVTDAFGNTRNLGKAQIILTKSMLKIFEYLNEEKISSLKKEDDHMKLYFDRFHKYDHALYVGITDMNLSYSGRTRLNYQFLNTLALDNDTFDEIIQNHIDLFAKATPKALLKSSVSTSVDDEKDLSFEDAVIETNTMQIVASQNYAFLREQKVKAMLEGIRYSAMKDVGRGRITVPGATRFLSRDLMALLVYMIDSITNISEEKRKQIKEESKEEKLHQNSFFVADCIKGNPCFTYRDKRLGLQSRTYYGILRSPHLSRNEQCSLHPYIPKKDGIFTRYFGHLKGILMVSEFSYVPWALGGADFDGDLVKLIADKEINHAINTACYEWQKNENNDKPVRVRKIPIIMIPDLPPRPNQFNKDDKVKVDFQTLKDTFSSKVGQLSNCAFSYGKQEYSQKNSNYQLKCETGTILVGLEIDAAKTGIHPNLDNYLKMDEKDYYIACKEAIEKLPQRGYFKVIESRNTKSNSMSVVGKCGRDKDRELMCCAIIDNSSKGYCQIDTLPQKSLSAISSLENLESFDSSGNRFAFEEDRNWKQQVNNQEKIERIKELIYAYKDVNALARRVNRNSEELKSASYLGHVNTILKLQNQSELAELSDNVFNQLLIPLDSREAAENALEKLVDDNRWQFLQTEEEKNNYISHLLFNDSDISSNEQLQSALVVLKNFRWNGYYLLYYFIKDIMLFYDENAPELAVEQANDEIKLSNPGSKIYEEFRQIFNDARMNKESQKIWKNKIIENCRKILNKLADNDLDTALMYVHYLRKIDTYGTFFWDVFNSNEILHS